MSTMLAKALEIASSAHYGKLDLNRQPYILHPLRVMGKVNGHWEKIVAILHDVVEDSDVSLEQISRAIPIYAVTKSIDALTRRSGESWREYLMRVIADEMAIKVKIADLEDNLDVKRFKEKLSKEDLNRIRMYHEAWLLLTGKLEELYIKRM